MLTVVAQLRGSHRNMAAAEVWTATSSSDPAISEDLLTQVGWISNDTRWTVKAHMQGTYSPHWKVLDLWILAAECTQPWRGCNYVVIKFLTALRVKAY